MKTKLWIARDKDGGLWLYEKEPKRIGNIFFNEVSIALESTSHPEITWENSPQRIEI